MFCFDRLWAGGSRLRLCCCAPQDGTHRWAFHIPMDPDSTEWQHGWAIIDAPKPIHLVTVVTMFRWFEVCLLHSHQAWGWGSVSTPCMGMGNE